MIRKNSKTYIYLRVRYVVKNTNNNKIINSESIESKYDVKNNGNYDMNLVKVEALDLKVLNNEIKMNNKKYNINDSNISSMKELRGKLF